MAIQPPSDLLLDVAAAADPAAVRAATARLARLAADPAAVDKDFGKALSAATKGAGVGPSSGAAPSAAKPSAAPPATLQASGMASLQRAPTVKGDVYQKFEAVLLQNFVESMLPKDDNLYGDKTSAEAYRSMMAEQLAGQIAKAGGIGIARAVAHAHPAHAAAPRPQEPILGA